MPSIEAADIRRILDSRGDATVEVDVHADGVRGRAAAPSGASTSRHEARAFPEGGVEVGIDRFREEVEPRPLGMEVTSQKGADRLLQEIDGTSDFSRLGGNVAVAASLAVAKAAAASLGLPLYRYLGGAFAHRLPHPMGNVIGGGRHAIGGTTIQEFLAVAQGPTVAASVFANARVHRVVRDQLRALLPSAPLGRGAEGAWVAPIDDFARYARLTELVGSHCRVIGDDVFATDIARLRKGIEVRAGNAILIKPNQIGTLSGAKAAVDLAHRHGYATVMSHRSGETTDETIAHLAVAFGCLAIKTGAVGGERIAKLNELIRIEEELVGS